MRYRNLLSLLFSVTLLSHLLLPQTLAQTATTATISGTVTDSTGAILPGAEIELLDTGTNQIWKQLTNETGQYVFPSVLPGVYNITVMVPGFRKATATAVKVEVAKSYTINVSLEVGQVSETVHVTTSAGAELQTTDSTIGTVIRGSVMPLFPALARQANELLMLQPLATPTGDVAGSRGDQSTFLLDGIDVTNQSIGGTQTYARLPIDGIEEFRVGVANPNAAFGRGAGGQVSLISQRGSNKFHGAAYWYHQNDNLNAATWTNKRTLGQTEPDPKKRSRLQEPELKDNRFGFNFGGPVLPWRDKAFVFLNYEGRRFPRSTSILRIVPADTLRQGILRFQDSAGSIVSYNLATSNLCGPSGDQPCDPRGIGMSPTIAAQFDKLPRGNDPSSGDHLNTIGFRGNVSNSLNNDYYHARFDYNLSSKWRADAAIRYFGELSEGAAVQPQPLGRLLSIVGGNIQSLEKLPTRQNMISAGVTGTFTPKLTGEFRFGWVRARTATDRVRPNHSGAMLAIPGTESGLSQGQSHHSPRFGGAGRGAEPVVRTY